VPEAIRDFLREFDALLLSRHGAMTVGRDVTDAYTEVQSIRCFRRGAIYCALKTGVINHAPTIVAL